MAKKAYLVIVLMIVFGAVVWILGSSGGDELQEVAILTAETQTENPIPETFVVNITEDGFQPNEVVIDAGDTVHFVNQSAKSRWPASDIHPTHQLYPGSGLIKCGAAEAGSIFDACRGLAPGESFSFTFNEKGAWFFHDHLQPVTSGKIIVQ